MSFPPPPGYGGQPAHGQPTYGQPAYGQPGGGPPPAPPAPPVRPPSIRIAVGLMWAGAALAALNGLLGFVLKDEIRDQVDEELARQDTSTSLDPDTLVNVALVIGLAGAAIGAGLWILHAVFTGKGQAWARISGSILFGVSLLFFLVSLAQPAPAVSRMSSVVGIVIGLAATVFLWQRSSSEFLTDSERAHRGY